VGTRVLAVAVALTSLFTSTIAAVGQGEDRLAAFIAALMGDRNTQIVFTEREAVALLNEGAKELFVDVAAVSARVNSVRFAADTATVNTDLTVGRLTLRPQVTFAVRTEGENVVLDIKRMRVGIVPVSVAAMLAGIRASGVPEYMQIHPLAGRIVVRKRGDVRYLEDIDIGGGTVTLTVQRR